MKIKKNRYFLHLPDGEMKEMWFKDHKTFQYTAERLYQMDALYGTDDDGKVVFDNRRRRLK